MRWVGGSVDERWEWKRYVFITYRHILGEFDFSTQHQALRVGTIIKFNSLHFSIVHLSFS